jgi:hypothetical protein
MLGNRPDKLSLRVMAERGTIIVPTRQEFRAAIEELNRRERRAYVYHVALEAVKGGVG